MSARGKFLFAGEEKLYVRGVTYGTFRPNGEGVDYPDRATVEHDFTLMAASGINSVRVYKAPPRWLLDIAARHGIYVMVGLAWEQHVAFLDERSRPKDIEARLRAGVRECAGHPAVLCYSIGNEIPAPVVRWHGRERVERFLERLYEAAKDEDPGALVTYVNYPSTEYLQLPFVDVVSFNVYLEERSRLESYLARLHNLAGDRPLLMAEIGLDSRRHGERTQADVLEWQLDSAFRGGCAGAFVFAWTDEWFVTFLDSEGRGSGGVYIEDWDFGLTDRGRRPKPALDAVRGAFAHLPVPQGPGLPSVSVVVCSHNGARTLGDCLAGLSTLDYPDFEVIVVDDGSTDSTAAIARESRFQVISTPHQGLASARNAGLAAATGEIVAYIDDDARPDPDWLTFLGTAFRGTSHVGIGGPNVEHPGDGTVARCVARAPGGPVHVLLSDTEAEHIPGCNCAFRRDALEAVGGFDSRFRTAGDDVDLCWRLRDRGWTLGFSPGAVVWHHSRASLRAYWRQQVGYGRAEALLERKWPEKYNVPGHLTWAGRLYGTGAVLSRLRSRGARIYHGVWGTNLFQSVYEPGPGLVSAIPSLPEWYLAVALLAVVSALGFVWPPLFLAVPFLAVALLAALLPAVVAAKRASSSAAAVRGRRKLRFLGITSALHAAQPPARLWGRLGYGLTPWRRRGNARPSVPRPRTQTVWSEQWRAPERWLADLEASLRAAGASVLRAGDYDSWDLEVRGGALGSVRIRALVEEHGNGRQLVRLHSRPRLGRLGFGLLAAVSVLAVAFAAGGAVIAVLVSLAGASIVGLRWLQECAGATGEVLDAIEGPTVSLAARGGKLEHPTTIEP